MKAIVFDNYLDKFNKINEYLKIDKVDFKIIKFKNGEGKVVINEDVSNEDIVIFSDFSNKLMYKVNNKDREYSSDEYAMELKRVISALNKAKSISVFLPLIYESRQNSENDFESKDYLLFIQELKNLKVDKIITFEVHGECDDVISYSLSPLFKSSTYDVVVSPDGGGIVRGQEYSDIMNCEFTYFKKQRDLTKIVDGSNPISKYSESEFDFTNKKVLIVDDILDSGSTLINAVNNIKNASRVDIFVAYPLFNKGVNEFKKLVRENKLDNIFISDLIKVDPLILKNKFIKVIDTSRLVSEVIK